MTVPTLPDSAFSPGWAGPSALEQLMIELVNLARANPQAEVLRIGTTAGALAAGASTGPVQPLAMVRPLDQSAQAHSDAMIARDFFAHSDPLTGQTPFQRMQAAGFTGYTMAGENISFIGSLGGTVTADRILWHHKNLWESDGHQVNLLRANYSEIGVGLTVGDYLGWSTSSMLTQNFGDRGHAYLTGVVIDDRDGDRFYDIGEGQGSVRITAWNDSGAFATSTFASGGYALKLAAGTWNVRFEGGDLSGVVVRSVTIGADNVKLDVFEATDAVPSSPSPSSPSSSSPAPSGPSPAPAPPPAPTGTLAEPDMPSALEAFLNAGSDTFQLANNRRNTMNGSSGDDRLDGRGGNDRLLGNDGHDVLLGGSGKDLLWGGAGDDVLHGGFGNDRMWGGAGEDVFVFARGEGRDRIEDFNTAQDTLALRGLWDGWVLDDHASVKRGSLIVNLGNGNITLVGVTNVDAVDWVLI